MKKIRRAALEQHLSSTSSTEQHRAAAAAAPEQHQVLLVKPAPTVGGDAGAALAAPRRGHFRGGYPEKRTFSPPKPSETRTRLSFQQKVHGAQHAKKHPLNWLKAAPVLKYSGTRNGTEKGRFSPETR